jgi:MerR family mercuric resistance operon transcriptional regulator
MQSRTSDKTYQIGELASRSGVTPDTLRYYERVGLLPKPHRTSGGFRVYSADTVEWLRFIKQAQTLGFTLREVRDLLGCAGAAGAPRCCRVRDMLRGKVSELQARLLELHEFQRLLHRYLEECDHMLQQSEQGGNEPPCPVIDTLKATR